MGTDTLSRRPSERAAEAAIVPCQKHLPQIALTPFRAAPVWVLLFLEGCTLIRSFSPRHSIHQALAAGLWPLLYFAVRRCLQAMNMVNPWRFASSGANIINAPRPLDSDLWNVGSAGQAAVGSGRSTAIARLTWPLCWSAT